MARFFPFFVCCGAEFCRGAGKGSTKEPSLPVSGSLRRRAAALCAGFRAAGRAEKQARIAEFGNNVEALRKVRDSAQGDVLPTRTRLEKLLKSVV